MSKTTPINAYDALIHVTCENNTRFNYRTEKLDCDSYEEIKNLTDLENYFNGGMEYYDDSVFGEEEWTAVREAQWCFATNEFERYVQDWMNNSGINSVISVLESGIYRSAASDLIHNKVGMKILERYRTDIEEIITDNASEEMLWTSDGNFSIPRIAVLAFEITVRKWTIDTLNFEMTYE